MPDPATDDPDGRIARLIAAEVPEIASGAVEIRAIARIPGVRMKVAVESHDPTLDAIGVCVGPRGSRIRSISAQLRGERIDILPWSTSVTRWITLALGPVHVVRIDFDAAESRAVAVVPRSELAAAVGPRGQHRELASRLTGVAIEVVAAPNLE